MRDPRLSPGAPHAAALPEHHAPDDLETDEELVRQMLAGERASYQMDKRYLNAAGNIVWVQLNVSLARDGAGAPMYFISQIQDIRERKRFEAHLQQVARHDHLTGLLNRRGFEELLERQIRTALRLGRVGALLVIDLDDFKAVNDTLGHTAGDRLLTDIARILSRDLRETDVFGRLGGDEFAIVLPEASRDQTDIIIAVLHDAIAHATPQAGGRIQSASIGTVALDGLRDLDDLLVAADHAMYTAKRARRPQPPPPPAPCRRAG